MNIAILSPSKNSYSETFIQAQKKYLQGKVYFYYNGFMPNKLEGHGSIIKKHLWVKKKLGVVTNNYKAESFLNSLKKNKIDVVLAHYGPTGEVVADICKQLKIPLVVHFHGYDASVTSVINSNDNYKKVFEIASKIIIVSKDMQTQLVKLGCPNEKLIYNPCAPEDSFIKIVPEFKKQQFIAVGRFTDKKAPYFTILAFKDVLNKFPEAKLLIGGDGPLLNMCKNLVEFLELNNNVEFLGVISPEEYRNLLKDSLAFVQHSIIAESGDKEGTPVAVMEANGAGLPVISTNHAGIPDVVLHKKTGILVAEKDVKAMSQAMIDVLSNIDYAKQLGASGKLRIKTHFNMFKHIDKLQHVLKWAVDNK